MTTQPFGIGKNLLSTQTMDSSSGGDKSFVSGTTTQKRRQWSSADLPKPEELFGGRGSRNKRAPTMSEHAAEVRSMCHQMETNKQLYERHQAEWRALNATLNGTYAFDGTGIVDEEEF